MGMKCTPLHMHDYVSARTAMELECLEDVTRDENVENSQELQVDDESELRTIPNSPDDFYIHLADYFDVMAGT
jgi:hypothetical protein